MPALRVGYVHAPEAKIEPIAAAVRATVYSAPPLMARIVARWVADGTAERLAAEKRTETRARNHRARELFAGVAVTGDPAAAHLWLTLPEPWRADDFAAAARRARGRHRPRRRLCRHPPAAQRGAHLSRRPEHGRAGRARHRKARGACSPLRPSATCRSYSRSACVASRRRTAMPARPP